MEYIIEPLREHAVDVGDLNLDPANANTHPEKNMDAIMASLREFGQRQVILAREGTNTVIAGNGRLMAARALGWEKIACVYVDDDDITAMRYAIADNRTSELSEWDGEVLSQLLQTIDDDFGSLEGTGFDSGDLDGLLSEFGGNENEFGDEKGGPDPDIDKAGELAKKWGTDRGQLWKIGEHRLIIGDCRSRDDVDRLLGGEIVNVAFTSPPYAQQREYDKDSGFEGIPEADYVDWFELVQGNVREYLSDDGSWFVNIKEHSLDGQRVLYVKDLAVAHVRRWGWRFVDEFIWSHGGLPGTWDNRFKNQFEPVFHFSPNRRIKFRPDSVRVESKDAFEYTGKLESANTENPISWSGSDVDRKEATALPGNVLNMGKSRVAVAHSAVFPERLPGWFIEAYTDKKDVVFDPFLGSGTTIVAAHNRGRRGFGVELSHKYAAVTLERLEQMGLKPELVDG